MILFHRDDSAPVASEIEAGPDREREPQDGQGQPNDRYRDGMWDTCPSQRPDSGITVKEQHKGDYFEPKLQGARSRRLFVAGGLVAKAGQQPDDGEDQPAGVDDEMDVVAQPTPFERFGSSDTEFALHGLERNAFRFRINEQDYEELEHHHGGKEYERRTP